MYPSRFEPKVSWKCNEVLTIKSLQEFKNIKKIYNFIMLKMKLFKKFKI